MGHPAIENQTPFAIEALFLCDEEARPLLVPIVKATYSIDDSGEIHLSENQLPINPAGSFHGPPGESSYRYEPETAFCKMATDVVLIGSAWASQRAATQVDVSLRAGPVSKRVRVIGDRYWIKVPGGPMMTRPEPFESIPLIYERAFGGRDKSGRFEPRNPVGRGFHSTRAALDGDSLLPNIEDPVHLIQDVCDTPAPAGFGFIGPDWHPRAAFAGTYGDLWTDTRMPLLPEDFNRRYFNAASAGLMASGYFKGDEFIAIENVSPDGPISFSLPGVQPPECRVQLKGTKDSRIETKLDTIIINTDERLLLLIWRGCLAIRNGPHDIRSLQIGTAA
jgi:hypothetical protein